MTQRVRGASFRQGTAAGEAGQGMSAAAPATRFFYLTNRRRIDYECVAWKFYFYQYKRRLSRNLIVIAIAIIHGNTHSSCCLRLSTIHDIMKTDYKKQRNGK